MRDAGKSRGRDVAGIEMIETIKASGAEDGYFEKWAGYQASVNTQQVKFQSLTRCWPAAPLVSRLCSTAVLMLACIWRCRGEFTGYDNGVSRLLFVVYRAC